MYFLLSGLLAPGSLVCLALTLEAHKDIFSIYTDLNLTSPSWSFLSTLQQNTISPFSFNTHFILFSSPRLAETLHLISYHRIKDFAWTKGLLLPQTRERAGCCACSLAHTAPLLALPPRKTPEYDSEGKLVVWPSAQMWDSVLLYPERCKVLDSPTLISAHVSLMGLKYYQEWIGLVLVGVSVQLIRSSKYSFCASGWSLLF